MIAVQIIFWVSAFAIAWAMGGYAMSLKLLEKLFPNRKLKKNYDNKPTVTVMIVAHNEEAVIEKKLENVIKNDYPKDRIEYLVTSDNSTDATNEIVENFAKSHPDTPVRLYVTKEHKGKTNAQNEAQKTVNSEILVMTDANSMFEENSITELVASFTAKDIVYVSGKLKYVNDNDGGTGASESLYWESELKQREIESNIKTITAGNGAIYACRNEYYYDFPAIDCHDSSMPYRYGLMNLRSVYNPKAIAYEKTGASNEDEFKRKVRMYRGLLGVFPNAIETANIFKHGWFSFFYFGHRTCRYLLWLAHTLVFITSSILAIHSRIFKFIFVFQSLFYLVALVESKVKTGRKIPRMVAYYSMTVLAQWIGAVRQIQGKSKATWDSVESTR